MDQAIKFWSEEHVRPRHVSWLEDPAVRRYVNRAVSGDPGVWPIEWLAARLGAAEIPRALSIGCGAGGLERSLIGHRVCARVDAFDGSLPALAAARRQAAAAGIGHRVRYFAADFNRPRLPAGVYDAVFFHQSLHHVAYLEKLLSAVLVALKPSGLLYVDEYVGPSRFEWTPGRMARYQALYEQLIPPRCRTHGELPRPIAPYDPSEAIRSSDIEPYLRLGFEIETRRDYGGNLIPLLYPFVDWSRAGEGLIDELVRAEEALLSQGEPAHYAVILLRPRAGIRRALARVRYFLDPKLRRVRTELKGRPG